MRTVGCVLLLLLALAGRVGAQFGLNPDQQTSFFGMELDQQTAHIGDDVKIRVRVHLGMQQKLIEVTPQLIGDVPDGMRVLGMDTMVVQKDGAYQGYMHLAFYRLGLQTIPDFRAIVRRFADPKPRALQADPLTITIEPMVPPGDPPIKDIRGLAKVGAINPWPIAGALAGAVLLAAYIRRRLRRPAAAPQLVAAEVDPAVPTALDDALARLNALPPLALDDASAIGERYTRIAAILHDYFVATRQVEPGATTSRVVAALSRLPDTDPLRARTAAVLGSADLVKFARARPGATQADAALATARDLLPAWDRALLPDVDVARTEVEADVPAR